MLLFHLLLYGRTQEILYEIQKSKQSEDPEFRREFDEVMEAPVYVDSPLATSATEIFLNNLDIFLLYTNYNVIP